MSRDQTKHVQPELTEEEYERFREFASEHGLSLKEAGYEAAMEWMERQQQADQNDPAFTVFEGLEDEALPASAETDAREEADSVEEWQGSDESFTLADTPSDQPELHRESPRLQSWEKSLSFLTIR